MMHDISIGILAGGNSSRMGTDKALVRIGNERIIDRLSKELGDFPEIMVSAGRNRSYEALGLKTVYDENTGAGPMEGIRQILLGSDNEYVFICAADMPFIKKELVEYMAGYICSDYDCYVIADDEHIHPLCAIYKKSAVCVIEELLAQKKYRLREIFSRIPTKYITIKQTVFEEKILRNINTREELFEARKPLVFCVSGFSDSGKTGLIERLINEFINDGMSVGVIKHDGHDCFSDIPGSDTQRFAAAGAVCTAVFSGRRYSLSFNSTEDADELIRKMESPGSLPDVIIIEGLKASRYPKVEVVRQKICDHSVSPPDTLICIATDCISPSSVKVPVFSPDDAKGIFLCVKEFFMKI